MAAPESVRPVLIRDPANASVPSAGFAHLFRSHSAASIVSVSLDFLTVFLDQGKVRFFGTMEEMERSDDPMVREFLVLDELILPQPREPFAAAAP